jgi:hypothetical protein
MGPIDALIAAAREAADLLSAVDSCSRNNFSQLASEVEDQLRAALSAVQNDSPPAAETANSGDGNVPIVDSDKYTATLACGCVQSYKNL